MKKRSDQMFDLMPMVTLQPWETSERRPICLTWSLLPNRYDGQDRMVGIDSQSLQARDDHQVHILHRNRTKKNLGIAGQHHRIDGATTVLKAHFYGSDDIEPMLRAIRQHSDTLFYGGQGELLAHAFVYAEHVSATIGVRLDHHRLDLTWLDQTPPEQREIVAVRQFNFRIDESHGLMTLTKEWVLAKRRLSNIFSENLAAPWIIGIRALTVPLWTHTKLSEAEKSRSQSSSTRRSED